MSYVSLATTTLSSATSSVTFGSIPATFKDLVLVLSGNASNDSSMLRIVLNSDTSTSNYSTVTMAGNNNDTTFSQSRTSDGYINITPAFAWNATSSVTGPNVGIVQIMDYAQTDKHKTALSRRQGGATSPTASAHRWASTSAVTSIQVSLSGANFTVGHTFSLYGIA
jgi:hypothetical protein